MCNTDTIHRELDVKKLHFDSTWIPMQYFIQFISINQRCKLIQNQNI
ncbi:MAG: hypothetical protein AB8V06_00130 [Francisella endosymbiont of Hyalomma asiaticum]